MRLEQARKPCWHIEAGERHRGRQVETIKPKPVLRAD
jgi:hypothetical protein